MVCELREARHQERTRIDRYVDIDQDAKAPLGTDGAPLSGFDIAIVLPDESVECSIEVKNYREQQLWRADQLNPVLQRVMRKLIHRASAGSPIQGRTEASVYCDIHFGERRTKGQVRRISDDGTVTRLRPDGTLPDPDRFIGSRNLYQDIAAAITKQAGHELLDALTLVCRDGRRIRFVRQGKIWSNTSWT